MSFKIICLNQLIFIILLVHILFPLTIALNTDTILDSELTIYVDDDNIMGPWLGTYENPYCCINDAIDNATSNDVIYVLNGIYNESVFIDKKLIFYGQDRNNTIINGGYKGDVLTLLSDNIELYGFKIMNSGGLKQDSGMKIFSDNNIVGNCIFHRLKNGVSIFNSSNNIFSNCSFYHNGNGIKIVKSTQNKLDGCIFKHNSIGFNSMETDKTILRYSLFTNNGIAVFLDNTKESKFFHCNISGNSDNHGGIISTDSSQITVDNCIISGNGMGIDIINSSCFSIQNTLFEFNTHFGVLIQKKTRDIKIIYCDIVNNLRYGVFISDDSECNLYKNNIFGNYLHGLYVEDSFCKARFNYWGAIFGPTIGPLRKSSMISFKPVRIRLFPWFFNPIENCGASWAINPSFLGEVFLDDYSKKIFFNKTDTDNDDIPDWWEIKYSYDPFVWDDHYNLDVDNDSLNNVEECYTDNYGSNPFKKDLFLEIDWVNVKKEYMPSNKPSKLYLEKLSEIFKNHGINLHFDIGSLGGGEEIPYINSFSFSELQDIYWEFFLDNDPLNPKKGIFHYAIVCDYGPDVNFPFYGWDNFDSMCISIGWMKDKLPIYTHDRLIVGGIAHQLGSSMGLLASSYYGNDNWEAAKPLSLEWMKYRNYKSCMNYRYKYKTFSYSDGTHGAGDYNDWDKIDLGFFKNSFFEISK